MNLSNKLKQGRLNKLLSQEKVAKQLNISRQSISKWENGYNYPDMDNLVELSKIYDISIDDLLMKKEIEEIGIDCKSVFLEDNVPVIEEFFVDHKGSGPKDEGLLLMFIALISSLLTPIGIIISGIVIHRNKKENTYYKLITTLCVFSILINIYFTYIVIGEWFDIDVENDGEMIK